MSTTQKQFSLNRAASKANSYQLAAVLCMMIGSGCASYHVTSDRSLQGKRAYEVIDAEIKISSFGWAGPVDQIGANENGFTIIEVTGATWIPNKETKYYGTAATYRWADIENVSVRASFGAILLCGILDPTSDSRVRLKFNDGTTKDISVGKVPMRVLPFWLFNLEWSRAHKAGKAFQTIVDSLKKDLGKTPAK